MVLFNVLVVGQNEVELDYVVDIFVLIINPGAGDDLQAVKKGIMEVADIILINKADGELTVVANHAKADYESSLKYIRQKEYLNQTNWNRQILLTSGKTNKGMKEFYEKIRTFYDLICNQQRVLPCTDVDWSMNRSVSLLEFKRLNQQCYWWWKLYTRSVSHTLSINLTENTDIYEWKVDDKVLSILPPTIQALVPNSTSTDNTRNHKEKNHLTYIMKIAKVLDNLVFTNQITARSASNILKYLTLL